MPSIEPFKFEGGRELEAALTELAAEAGNNRSGKAAMRKAMLASLEPFVKLWQSMVPVLSGRYRERIWAGTRLTRRQTRMARADGKSGVEVYAGTDDPAGQHQEFGTAHHPSQPSARQAWEQSQNQVLADLGTQAWEHLRKTAERLARKKARRGN